MNASFRLLSKKDQDQILARLDFRKDRYQKLLDGSKKFKSTLLLVGDRPGPSAPADPNYHHTPFYSTKHCSGWLNTALHLEKIDESNLLWINAYNKDKIPTDINLVKRAKPRVVIALGGSAAKWLKHHNIPPLYRYGILRLTGDLKALRDMSF